VLILLVPTNASVSLGTVETGITYVKTMMNVPPDDIGAIPTPTVITQKDHTTVLVKWDSTATAEIVMTSTNAVLERTFATTMRTATTRMATLIVPVCQDMLEMAASAMTRTNVQLAITIVHQMPTVITTTDRSLVAARMVLAVMAVRAVISTNALATTTALSTLTVPTPSGHTHATVSVVTKEMGTDVLTQTNATTILIDATPKQHVPIPSVPTDAPVTQAQRVTVSCAQMSTNVLVVATHVPKMLSVSTAMTALTATVSLVSTAMVTHAMILTNVQQTTNAHLMQSAETLKVAIHVNA
jgi:hypothetical protein